MRSDGPAARARTFAQRPSPTIPTLIRFDVIAAPGGATKMSRLISVYLFAVISARWSHSRPQQHRDDEQERGAQRQRPVDADQTAAQADRDPAEGAQAQARAVEAQHPSTD